MEKALATGEPAFAEIGVQDLAAAWSAEGATPTAEAADEDSASTTHLSPPLHRLFAFEESETDASGEQQVQRITIVARMDREHPLTEAKWVRTGNPDEWIQSVIGNSGSSGLASSIGGTRAAQQLPKGEQGKTTHLPSPTSVTSTNYRDNRGSSAWKGKIRVVDPDAVRLSLLRFDMCLSVCAFLLTLLSPYFVSFVYFSHLSCHMSRLTITPTSIKSLLLPLSCHLFIRSSDTASIFQYHHSSFRSSL